MLRRALWRLLLFFMFRNRAADPGEILLDRLAILFWRGLVAPLAQVVTQSRNEAIPVGKLCALGDLDGSRRLRFLQGTREGPLTGLSQLFLSALLVLLDLVHCHAAIAATIALVSGSNPIAYDSQVRWSRRYSEQF